MNEHKQHYQYIDEEFQPKNAFNRLSLAWGLSNVFKRCIRLKKKNKTKKDEFKDICKIKDELEYALEELPFVFKEVEYTYFNRFISYYSSIFNKLDNDYLRELIIEFKILHNKVLLNKFITFEDKKEFIKNLQQKFTALNILHYPELQKTKLKN